MGANKELILLVNINRLTHFYCVDEFLTLLCVFDIFVRSVIFFPEDAQLHPPMLWLK